MSLLIYFLVSANHNLIYWGWVGNKISASNFGSHQPISYVLLSQIFMLFHLMIYYSLLIQLYNCFWINWPYHEVSTLCKCDLCWKVRQHSKSSFCSHQTKSCTSFCTFVVHHTTMFPSFTKFILIYTDKIILLAVSYFFFFDKVLQYMVMFWWNFSENSHNQ